MPLHKSAEGWARLRRRTQANRGVHCARMDFRPRSRVQELKSPRAVEELELDGDVAHIESMRSAQFPNRRRVVIAD